MVFLHTTTSSPSPTISEWIITSCNHSTCSLVLTLNSTVKTWSNECFIPSWTLTVGTYQMTLNVQLADRLSVRASSSVYVQISPSDTIPNLLSLGTSMITQGSAQDLVLNSGRYSVDPDADIFDAPACFPYSSSRVSKVFDRRLEIELWKWFSYLWCIRFSNTPRYLLPVDDSRSNPLNLSCLCSRTGTECYSEGIAWESMLHSGIDCR